MWAFIGAVGSSSTAAPRGTGARSCFSGDGSARCPWRKGDCDLALPAATAPDWRMIETARHALRRHGRGAGGDATRAVAVARGCRLCAGGGEWRPADPRADVGSAGLDAGLRVHG